MTKDYEDRRLALAADMNRMGGAAMLDMADSIRRDRDAVERARAVLDRLEPEDRDAVDGAFGAGLGEGVEQGAEGRLSLEHRIAEPGRDGGGGRGRRALP